MQMYSKEKKNAFSLRNIFNAYDSETFSMRINFGSSDGRMVRASASGAEDSGLIPSRVKPMTLKLVFTSSLLDAQH